MQLTRPARGVVQLAEARVSYSPPTSQDLSQQRANVTHAHPCCLCARAQAGWTRASSPMQQPQPHRGLLRGQRHGSHAHAARGMHPQPLGPLPACLLSGLETRNSSPVRWPCPCRCRWWIRCPASTPLRSMMRRLSSLSRGQQGCPRMASSRLTNSPARLPERPPPPTQGTPWGLQNSWGPCARGAAGPGGAGMRGAAGACWAELGQRAGPAMR